jgi:hypothetical protein
MPNLEHQGYLSLGPHLTTLQPIQRGWTYHKIMLPLAQFRWSGHYINVAAWVEGNQKIVQTTFHGHNLNSLTDILHNTHTDRVTSSPQNDM